jgi:hypothetical protein
VKALVFGLMLGIAFWRMAYRVAVEDVTGMLWMEIYGRGEEDWAFEFEPN